MRIDLHCHTKKVKTGDAYTRNVTKDKFFQKVIEAEVKIIAITNHNQFDYMQYKEFKDVTEGYCDSSDHRGSQDSVFKRAFPFFFYFSFLFCSLVFFVFLSTYLCDSIPIIFFLLKKHLSAPLFRGAARRRPYFLKSI